VLLVSVIVLVIFISYFDGFNNNGFKSVTGNVVIFGGSCSDDFKIYQMFDSDATGAPYNSHVSLWNDSTMGVFAIDVCDTVDMVNHDACGLTPVDANSSQVVFWLNNINNSHISQNNKFNGATPLVGPGTLYDIPICHSDKYCEYFQDPASCTNDYECSSNLCFNGECVGSICGGFSGYDCLGSMSDDYNAHVGVCEEYDIKVCCGFQPLCIDGVTFDSSTQCCNPFNGVTTTIDDVNDCTIDVCNTQTGIVSHPPEGSGLSCDDGDACTTGDMCDGAGACFGTFDPLL